MTLAANNGNGNGNGSMSNKKDLRALSSAPPPWHSVALVGGVIGVSLYSFPSMENMDHVATVETFTNRVFPDLLSLEQLAYIRLFLAATIWVVTFHMAVLSNGWVQIPAYMKGSKLIIVPNKLIGIKTLLPFTSFSWMLLGLSFMLSGYIALKQATADGATTADEVLLFSPLLLRTAFIVWEISAPFTFIVAFVVRYAIWPAVLKESSSENLRSVRNIFMHNLNVVFALLEAAILGGIPVRGNDFAIGPLVGCAYIIFSWATANCWNEKQYGPQFIYFFFDTTLPGYLPSYVILGLLSAFMLFYLFFVSVEIVLEAVVPYGVMSHLVAVAAISSTLMRFRD